MICQLLEIVDDVLPVTTETISVARVIVIGHRDLTAQIVIGHRDLTARDAIHLAIMREHGIERILSFARHFDALPGVTRLH